MRLATTAALVATALALSACTDQQINKTLAAITGELDNLTDEHAALKAELAAAQSAGSPATDAELDALRRQYAELALRLESVGYQPEVLPELVEPVIEPPIVEPEPEPAPEPTPPPFECVSIFRVQTCEEGVLYMLDDQMGWTLAREDRMTQRQRTLAIPADPNDIRTSTDFLTYVESQKIAAQRRVDDLKGSITELVTTNARLKADYETAVQRNNVLIADHRLAIDDEQAIIAAADRALDFGRVAAVTQESEQ